MEIFIISGANHSSIGRLFDETNCAKIFLYDGVNVNQRFPVKNIIFDNVTKDFLPLISQWIDYYGRDKKNIILLTKEKDLRLQVAHYLPNLGITEMKSFYTKLNTISEINIMSEDCVNAPPTNWDRIKAGCNIKEAPSNG